MRELSIDVDNSSPEALVLRASADDGEGQEYRLPITEQLRELVNSSAESEKDQEEESKPVEAAKERSLPPRDPLYSNPLTMRPREIQQRIRAGASAKELAEEMEVALNRVEPFAHPIMQERQRVAEMGKQAHPVQEHGPSSMTLAEVLSAAFSVQGHSLSQATWDAYREPDDDWIIRVTWQTGLSENYGEWALKNFRTSNATAEPRNSVAVDLSDPEFSQPVRTLSSVSAPVTSIKPQEEEDCAPEIQETSEEFLKHPGTEPAPTKRRRKAVTPHWEDVLLGVRSNTKRPRS